MKMRAAAAVVAVVAVVLVSLLAVGSQAYPVAHYIQNVPYYRQLTDYSCGDTSLQMVLDYYGEFINQFSIIDAARTTEDQGTLSYDIVRVGQFSALSSSVGDLFPDVVPINGFPGHPIGYAAFDYSSNEQWLDQVKELVSRDIPVICLMHYSLNPADGGHFRVVVGYNDTIGNITLHDPWDYDGNPPIANWDYDYFLALWNYTEVDSPRGTPFMGAAIYPWPVEVNVNTEGSTSTVMVNVSYPCYAPFNCSRFVANMVTVTLYLPDNTTLLDDQQQSYLFNSLAPTESLVAKWVITCGEECAGLKASITAQGIIQGWLPASYKLATVNYPPYSYVDAIGGSAEFVL